MTFPHDAVVIRFGTNTPYYLLTFSYGIFVDPSTRMPWTSVDAYLGYHMLVRRPDREEVVRAPNGYIAYRNLSAIVERAQAGGAGGPVVSPTWERDRDSVLREALRLKYTQSTCLAEMLVRTGDRPIFDASRREDPYWCAGDGDGANVHGRMLEALRASLARGEVPAPVALGS